jgi:dihydroxyacetone kinase-like protein
MINGGSAVPLWYTYLDGLSQGAPETDSLSAGELQAMFEKGLQNLSEISKARVGDKTMMDALIPATEAMNAQAASAQELFAAAAAAAEQGSERTKNVASRFGRARSYGEQTIGTPDAGAVSAAAFMRGLAKQLE